MTTPTALCPVDFSDHSRRALEYAAALAAHFGGRVVVAHIVDPLLAAAERTYQIDPLGDEARDDLERFVSPVLQGVALSAHGIELSLTQGVAASEILKLAAKHRADVIVMGTHGLSGFRKMFYGSTTARVLRHAEVPVLAVPPGDDKVAGTGRLRLQGCLLAPVDFSEASNRAARIAAGISKALSLPLVLLHVVAPLRTMTRWQDAAAEGDRARVEEARVHLTRLASTLTAVPADLVVTVGDPGEEIARVAVERGAGAIVMGLQGTGLPLVGRAPGSVATTALSLAPVPILAIPPAAGDQAGGAD